MRWFLSMILSAILIGLPFVFFVHPSYSAPPQEAPLLQNQPGYNSPWVDSVFQSLTLDQRIAQLLMVRVHTDQDDSYYDAMARLVKTHNVGGVAFFRGGPVRQVLMTNRLQSQVQTPLLIAMDAEWGPAMRLDSILAFPRQMALGSITDDQLIYEMGSEIGRQLNRLGVHINFAPVVDVNNNPDNPVIGFRAFGESRERVADKGIAYMQGMQDQGIIACAKHFPGHGDTDADSHHTLPLLTQSFEEIDSIHLYPFKKLIEAGLGSVMIAHLEMPALEPEERLASTLSHNIVTKLLQEDMGFHGLVITDALDMRGVSDHFSPGDLELRALLAGNDILLLPEDVPAAIGAIRNALGNGHLSEDFLNKKVKKILHYKEKSGLDRPSFIPLDHLIADLTNNRTRLINDKLAAASLTLLRNENGLIPVKDLHRRKIAAVSIGSPGGNLFHTTLSKYAPLSQYSIDKDYSPEDAGRLLEELEPYDLVIVSIHDNSFFLSRNYGINPQTIELIDRIAGKQEVILGLFANPYSLNYFGDGILDVEAVLMAHQDGVAFEKAAAMAIFGGIQINGKLPVTAGSHFPLHRGIVTPAATRLRFGIPENVGIRSELLEPIDSIIHAGMAMEAFPGCQVAVVKDGTVIYHRAFGHHTYEKEVEVLPTDAYDLASLTKLLAATASVMRLVDEQRVDIDRPLSHYLTWLKGTQLEDIGIRELMAHQARLTPWIPFYQNTMEEGIPLDGVYQTRPSPDYPILVADGLYLHQSYRDSIFESILNTELLSSNEYRYSDLGFILLPELVEEITGQGIDRFGEQFLYKPLGLQHTGYLPLLRNMPYRIPPTELDTLWRKQMVRGHVHDPAAAMLGGVSGHAGLFSNALEVAILMQVFLNEGSYGGRQYFSKATLDEFTRVQYPENNNRRGLGFDKPDPGPKGPGACCESASPISYGHSGFTGTLAWADPENNLIYVFLSNRTFPDQQNNLIVRENIRTNIQQVIYDAIEQSSLNANHDTTHNTQLP